MPLFRRVSKPVAPPSFDLPNGEEVERGLSASLLRERSLLKGRLYMTNRRLLFEADRGEARWLSVPYDEVRSAGLYRWTHATISSPRGGNRCLVIETTKDEQVWLDFAQRDEDAWLPLVKQHAQDASAAPPTDA